MSMISNIQRLTTVGLISCAIGLLLHLWGTSPIMALVVFFAILFSHSMALAFQFAVLPWVNTGDASPPAHFQLLLYAWIQETVASARVFFWWQPFRSRLIPDQLPPRSEGGTRRGVILVHGFLCNRAVWMPWMRELKRRRIPFVAVNLEPVFGSIDSYVSILDHAVREMRAMTGKPPLMVCHSMGGLAARAWYQTQSGQACAIHGIVTIASPHDGTRISRLFQKTPGMANVDQMRRGSMWLAALAQKETAAQRSRFRCYYSNCDNIVMPASTACMEGAENRFIAGVPHVAMALDPKIMRDTLAMLDD